MIAVFSFIYVSFGTGRLAPMVTDAIMGKVFVAYSFVCGFTVLYAALMRPVLVFTAMIAIACHFGIAALTLSGVNRYCGIAALTLSSVNRCWVIAALTLSGVNRCWAFAALTPIGVNRLLV